MSIVNEIETEFFTRYVQRLNKTIIFERKIYNGKLISTKIIDWYYGDEDAEIIERLVKEYLQGGSRLKEDSDIVLMSDVMSEVNKNFRNDVNNE